MPANTIFTENDPMTVLRLTLEEHYAGRDGGKTTLDVGLKTFATDMRTAGRLVYPDNTLELIDGDVRSLTDRFLWTDRSEVIRYLARQQRQINRYSKVRRIES